MDIYMIWVQEDDCTWLLESWDEGSIDSNGLGWEEAKDKAYNLHGAEHIRIIKACIDFDKVLATFKPATTTLSL